MSWMWNAPPLANVRGVPNRNTERGSQNRECYSFEFRLNLANIRRVEKAIRKAGVSDFHWHDLRHTFASRLAMSGVGLRAIQDALGHKSIAMTVRYSHLAPDFLLDVVEKLVPKPAENEAATVGATATTTAIEANLPVSAQSALVQ